ncbi:MAG: RNA polymerase sigma factor [Spirochaetia bacterium]
MNFQEPKDREIVDRVKRGDPECFRILVERHSSRVYSLGMKFFHNQEDAQDFTQEVFIKAFRGIGAFKKRSSFSTWLIKIAYNYGIDMISAKRKQQKTSEFTGYEQPGDQYSKRDSGALMRPEQEEEHKELTGRLEQALQKLPKRYALCIEFSFYFGFTYGAISDITGIPLNTVKSHILRGKKILRKSLENEDRR